ncbi:MAG: hypothetical protein A2Z40_04460 [Deltaproteobacteria bacterium RBG_19FT_COMBO_60_16]|nr:MAG: hypothetical protein A2Z40_04460 [Deltaproteobacteria bacterium RBG_19FT_COMBO_60_16]
MSNFKRMLEKMVEDQRRLQEQMKEALGPSQAIQEAMKQALAPSQAIQEAMKHFMWVSEVQKRWASDAEVYFSGLTPDAINVTPSGDIVLGRETVRPDDVAKNLARLNKQLASASTPIDYFRRLFSFLKRRSPALAKVLFLLLFTIFEPVLQDLTRPITEPLSRKLTGRSKDEGTTKIRENAINKYDPQQLENHRFVTATRLRVRTGPSKEHKVRGVLSRGKIVRIVRMKHHWTQVAYFDDDQQKEYQGWVATSYLARFTNH